MEFRIAKTELPRGLRLAQGIADRKSTMPMLANVLLRTQGKNQLLVAATDLNVSLTAEHDPDLEPEDDLQTATSSSGWRPTSWPRCRAGTASSARRRLRTSRTSSTDVGGQVSARRARHPARHRDQLRRRALGSRAEWAQTAVLLLRLWRADTTRRGAAR
jgi:hypothetical protein